MNFFFLFLGGGGGDGSRWWQKDQREQWFKEDEERELQYQQQYLGACYSAPVWESTAAQCATRPSCCPCAWYSGQVLKTLSVSVFPFLSHKTYLKCEMFLQKLEHAEDEEGLERSQQNSEIFFC